MYEGTVRWSGRTSLDVAQPEMSKLPAESSNIRRFSMQKFGMPQAAVDAWEEVGA